VSEIKEVIQALENLSAEDAVMAFSTYYGFDWKDLEERLQLTEDQLRIAQTLDREKIETIKRMLKAANRAVTNHRYRSEYLLGFRFDEAIKWLPTFEKEENK